MLVLYLYFAFAVFNCGHVLHYLTFAAFKTYIRYLSLCIWVLLNAIFSSTDFLI